MYNKNIIEKYDKKPDVIMQFLALFNQIDKHFDKMLWTDGYLPFNEKVKRIINWNYYISRFVKLHQFQIKYFGEIRNQITHGIKLDGHTYVYPSEYAIAQLARYADSIKKPPRCIDLFGRKVFTCKSDDKLINIIKVMEDHDYSHVPVYDENENYIWVLNESELLSWLTKDENWKDIKNIKVWDIPLIHDSKYVIFVHKKYNIYEIDKLFTLKKERKEKLGVVFITENGRKDEYILWIITAGDTALVDTYVIH